MPSSTAKVFTSGNSQAIRLPKEFRLDTDEVFISRSGDSLILTPRKTSWDGFIVPVHVPCTGNGKRANPWRRRVMAVCRYSQGEWPR